MKDDKRNGVTVLGKAAYMGALLLMCATVFPFEAFHPWSTGLFATAIAALGMLRLADHIVYARFAFSQPLILLPLGGVALLATFQIIPTFSGSPLSMDPYGTRAFMIVFGALLVFAEILFTYTRTTRHLRQLTGLVIAIVLGSSIFGMVGELPQANWPGTVSSPHPQQSYAQFINRNHFALLLEMGLGLLVGVLLRSEIDIKTKFAGWMTVGYLAYSMINAGSRGGLVSMTGIGIFAVFVYVLTRSGPGPRAHGSGTSRSYRRSSLLSRFATAAILGSMVLATVIVLVAYMADDALIRRIERIDTEVGALDDSRENRAAIWASTVGLIKERPILGSGFGAYDDAITRFDGSNGRVPLEEAHNEYLEILANGGLIAAIFFGVFGVFAARQMVRNMRSPDSFRRAAAFGAVVGITGVVIHSTVDFGLHVLVNALIFVVLVVIATARVVADKHGDHRIDGYSRRGSSRDSRQNTHAYDGRMDPSDPAFSIRRALRSHATALAYLIAVVVLGVAGARSAASNYYAQRGVESASVEESQNAVAVDPSNPAGHRAYAVALAQAGDYVAAAEALTRATELRPNDYRLWMELGDVWSQAGESVRAEKAYLQSVDLAPRYALPRMRLGLMHLDAARNDKAFEWLGSAARLDPLFYPEVLHHAEAVFGGNAQAIEQAVAPESKDGKTVFALYLIDRSWMTDHTKQFLVGDELTPEEKNKLINHLISKRDYRLAREVWLSKLEPDLARFAGKPLFDGGFESMTEMDPDGLGWQLEMRAPYTSISRIQKDVHSGAYALHIRFNGNADLQRPVVSQVAFVEGGTRYRLTFFVRATELISGGLPVVVVSDAHTNSIIAASEPIQDTKGIWAERSVVFKAPDSSSVLVSVQRPQCSDRPCPIFGEFSVDDFSIDVVH